VPEQNAVQARFWILNCEFLIEEESNLSILNIYEENRETVFRGFRTTIR